MTAENVFSASEDLYVPIHFVNVPVVISVAGSDKSRAVAKTALISVIFFLLFITSKYLRIAPGIISFVIPLGLFFVDKKSKIIYSFVISFLIMISGFLTESYGIFFLLFIPLLFREHIKNKTVKIIFYIIYGYISVNIFNYFFPLKTFIPLSENFIIYFLPALYFLFCIIYPVLLEKLKDEILNILPFGGD